ncbi:DUF3761 domain-containing protein [Streptomyces sp. NPDC004327]|uniref:DUF3761 domain-containing protein n=1 Tax=Streptomyces sp. NPDC004327 TaxID=3364699 RepID=UPI00369D2D45
MAQNQRPQPTAEDKKNFRVGCGVILAALLAIGGCNALINDDNDSSSSSSSSTSAYDGKTTTIRVGDFVGMGLQAAQDAAQDHGIYHLDSTDATGQGRQQLFDRNWTVCSQTPAAGATMSTTDTLTFDTVKSSEGETCNDPTGSGSSDTDGGDSSSTAPGTEGNYSSGGSSTTAGTGDNYSNDSSSSGSRSSTGGSESSGSDSSSSSSSGGTSQAPTGATAQCNDGTYSYSAHRRGTCSHHGGVAVWLASVPS